MRRLLVVLFLCLFTSTSYGVVEVGPFGPSTAVPSKNEQIINSVNDFPSPIGGVIYLEDNTNYIISANISTPNRIQLGENDAITSNNVFIPLFEYTGSDPMFTGVDVNLQLSNIRLKCSNATVFDLSSPTTVGGDAIFANGLVIEQCSKIATFNNLNDVDMSNCTFIDATDGITVLGSTNWSIFSLNKFAVFSSSASFVGLDFGTSVHNTIDLGDLIFRAPASAVGISGLVSSANLNTGQLATVKDSEFSGGLTPLQNITTSDIRWVFKDNAGVEDTLIDALTSFSGNATETTITTINTPVKVNATWTCSRVSKFSCDTTGRLTYTGEKATTLPVDFSAGLISSGGTPINASAYIALNGSVISATKVTLAISGATALSFSTPWQITFSENDYIELFIENNTNTNNIIVQRAVQRIR